VGGVNILRHGADVPKKYSHATSDEIERTKIAKLQMRASGLVGKSANQSLDNITFAGGLSYNLGKYIHHL
jgi:hypothetical protein